MPAFWRRIVDEPDVFLLEFWLIFLHSILTASGKTCRPGFVGMTWRRLITVRCRGQWRLRLEKVNRKVRQFGISGAVDYVGRRARVLHTGNWLVITHCSNDLNTVKRKAVLAGVAKRVPALTTLVANCYGTRPADVMFRTDSGENRTIACSSGGQQLGPLGPAIFCPPLRPGLKHLRGKSKIRGVEASRTWTTSLSAFGSHDRRD